MSQKNAPRIAFQGALGAYSHEACLQSRPDMIPVPCLTFEDVFHAVRDGRADLAMLPVENTTYGRVADIHRLLPKSGLHIIDEAFVRVRISLMARPGVALEDIKHVRAHMVLIPQARRWLDAHGIGSESATDSAGAAQELAASGERDVGVLASEVAADIHGLTVLARDIEDLDHNTTRFLLMAPLRGPQHSCGLVQGHGRVCDKRCEHDQAGKLYGRWIFYRDAVLFRHRRASRGSGRTARFGRIGLFHQHAGNSGRLSCRSRQTELTTRQS
jgi:prephenate dehydratase